MSHRFAEPDRLLYGERLRPLTTEVGFVAARVTQTVQAFCDWQAPIHARRGVELSARPVSGTLATLLQQLLPLTSVEQRRWLFTPTRGDWTACFGNGRRGGDVVPAMAVLAEDLRCRTVRVTASSSAQTFPSLIMQVWDPGPPGALPKSRSIAFANDGGRITSEAYGDPLPFEDPSSIDAFSFGTLKRYLSDLGIDAFGRSFYAPGGKGCLVEKRGPTVPGVEEFDLPAD